MVKDTCKTNDEHTFSLFLLILFGGGPGACLLLLPLGNPCPAEIRQYNKHDKAK